MAVTKFGEDYLWVEARATELHVVGKSNAKTVKISSSLYDFHLWLSVALLQTHDGKKRNPPDFNL